MRSWAIKLQKDNSWSKDPLSVLLNWIQETPVNEPSVLLLWDTHTHTHTHTHTFGVNCVISLAACSCWRQFHFASMRTHQALWKPDTGGLLRRTSGRWFPSHLSTLYFTFTQPGRSGVKTATSYNILYNSTLWKHSTTVIFVQAFTLISDDFGIDIPAALMCTGHFTAIDV